jgi:hypothetical protein
MVALSALSQSQLVMLAEFCKDVVEVGLQGFGVPDLEGHPLVLDLAPEDLDETSHQIAILPNEIFQESLKKCIANDLANPSRCADIRRFATSF